MIMNTASPSTGQELANYLTIVFEITRERL